MNVAEYEPGYVAAVADSLLFCLGDRWEQLSAHDHNIERELVQSELERLSELDVQIDFGDGEVPVIPAAGAASIAKLRIQLERIRTAAPNVFAAGATTYERILCTDPWPRVYTSAVLKWPASSPVHVVQASDLAEYPDQWQSVAGLVQFTELRALRLFGAPLGHESWPLSLKGFPQLQTLDLSSSHLQALPPDVANASALEAIELGDNPLDPISLDALLSLSALRYIGLGGTGIRAAAIANLRARLPATCEIALV
jgi:Leucine-rich repeat (LRR) protein